MARGESEKALAALKAALAYADLTGKLGRWMIRMGRYEAGAAEVRQSKTLGSLRRTYC